MLKFKAKQAKVTIYTQKNTSKTIVLYMLIFSNEI